MQHFFVHNNYINKHFNNSMPVIKVLIYIVVVHKKMLHLYTIQMLHLYAYNAQYKK